MLYPSIWHENLFDDLMDFDFPSWRTIEEPERKLYGKHAATLMKTDVQEHENGYEVDIDLPGFKKEDISLELEDGTLTVKASKGLEENKEDKKGRLIRQERYTGSMQRSFYVGDNVTPDEISARYEDGVLRLSVPKKEEKKLPEKKTIAIEG
jgi:HSP20 family molecular chaperone IbpA